MCGQLVKQEESKRKVISSMLEQIECFTIFKPQQPFQVKIGKGAEHNSEQQCQYNKDSLPFFLTYLIRPDQESGFIINDYPAQRRYFLLKLHYRTQIELVKILSREKKAVKNQQNPGFHCL